MKGSFKLACGMMILALWAAPVYSAVKMVPEEGAVEVMLLRQQSVQKDLKLTADEVEKVHNFCAKQWEKAQAIGKLPDKEQDKKFAELQKENEKFVESTLTKDQRKRLDEITLQVAGIMCLGRHHVASKLKLTSDQKKKVEQMQKESRQEAEDLIHSTAKDQKRDKLKQIQQTSRKRIMELLTDEQEVTWKELCGAPFKGDLAYFDAETAGK